MTDSRPGPGSYVGGGRYGLTLPAQQGGMSGALSGKGRGKSCRRFDLFRDDPGFHVADRRLRQQAVMHRKVQRWQIAAEYLKQVIGGSGQTPYVRHLIPADQISVRTVRRVASVSWEGPAFPKRLP
mgnify:FL=1